LISTSGGFPGEKKRSLILSDVFNMAVNSPGVEICGAGAAPAAVGVGAAGTRLVAEGVEDMQSLILLSCKSVEFGQQA